MVALNERPGGSAGRQASKSVSRWRFALEKERGVGYGADVEVDGCSLELGFFEFNPAMFVIRNKVLEP